MKKTNIFIALLLAITLLLGACGESSNSSYTTTPNATPIITMNETSTELPEDSSATAPSDESSIITNTEASKELLELSNLSNDSIQSEQPDVSGTLSVHFIDVGQADCVLVQLPNNEVMLIDAGNNGDAELIISYLKSLNITTINYLIGTHPHEDHIGSLDSVIDTFEIENIYMPKATATTQTFEDVLTAIANKGVEVNTAKAGVQILNYPNLQSVMLAPNGDTYDNLNDYSAVIKLTYGDASYLFTGDAETLSENEMLDGGYDLSCDVLKVGHHGSDTSTSDSFLSAISPSYAVISCGLDNSYGHPADSVLQRLLSSNVSVYNTAQQGTIVITSDGSSIHVDKDALSESELQAGDSADSYESIASSDTEIETETQVQAQPESQPESQPEPDPKPEPDNSESSTIVYVTKTGEKYHRDSCSYLKKSKIETTLDNAKAQGYTSCSRCEPPR